MVRLSIFSIIFMLLPTLVWPASVVAPVKRSGQKTSFLAGDDGALQKGAVWPNPRFTDNSDGTVTDNLTGLVWLKNANCFGTRDWATALSDASGLANGACGLTDRSAAGDWRLPTRKELKSLITYEYSSPPLPNTAGTGKWSEGDPFTNVQAAWYWSSTTYAYSTDQAHAMTLSIGNVGGSSKIGVLFVWLVRGGQ